MPVALAAWFVGPRTALMVSTASAASWLLANRLAGERFSNALIVYWNTGIRLGFFVITTLLLTELRRALDRQRALARTDPLTEALNGRAFAEVAHTEILRARRHGRPLTVAYLDLDNFKQVNDRFGHSVGDVVLQTVVATIRSAMRPTDTVARLGGDEFGMILPETDSLAAHHVATRVREYLAQQMLRGDWPVTMSIGIVTCREPPEAVDALLRVADGLMYEAKPAGKDSIHQREYGALFDDEGTDTGGHPDSHRALEPPAPKHV